MRSRFCRGLVADSSRQRTGRLLENPTKQSIRKVFSVLSGDAQRYEFVPGGHNPIQLVRQSGKRSRIPDILTAGKINARWTKSKARERAAISSEYGNGLRISEAFGLKWSDIDFVNGTASVIRSVVRGYTGDTAAQWPDTAKPIVGTLLQTLPEIAPMIE